MDDKKKQLIIRAISNINDLSTEDLIMLGELGFHVTGLLKQIYPTYKPTRTSALWKQHLLNPTLTEKPKQHTKLGRTLTNYISPSCSSYDPEFTEVLRKAKPDWFKSRAQVMEEEFDKELNRRSQAAVDAYLRGDHHNMTTTPNPTPVYNPDIDINDDDPDLAHPMFDVFRNK